MRILLRFSLATILNKSLAILLIFVSGRPFYKQFIQTDSIQACISFSFHAAIMSNAVSHHG